MSTRPRRSLPAAARPDVAAALEDIAEAITPERLRHIFDVRKPAPHLWDRLPVSFVELLRRNGRLPMEHVLAWFRQETGLTAEEVWQSTPRRLWAELEVVAARASRSDPRNMDDTRREILKVLVGRSLGGRAIAKVINRSDEYTRRLLAQLRKDGYLSNDREGYHLTGQGQQILRDVAL